MSSVASQARTGNPYIDGLLTGTKWGTRDLTYSFPDSPTDYHRYYGSGEPGNNFSALNATQKAVARAAFESYASVANLSFTEISGAQDRQADLRLAESDRVGTAWGYYPSVAPEGGDMWFTHSSGIYDQPQMGNYAYKVFMHEIGHALGLEHPHEGNVMPFERHSIEYSVMSYRSYVGASTMGGDTNETWGHPQSLMMYDIAALQQMYGANYNTNSGDTVYSWSSTTGEMFIDGAGQGAPGGNRIFRTVWDGGGVDTYDFSNYTTGLTIDLRPGHWTTTSHDQLARLRWDGSELATGNIANALLHEGDTRSLIENAKGGSANDLIVGNQGANTLWGNSGNDWIDGGAGNDVLIGGAGRDMLIGGAGFDYASYEEARSGVTARLDYDAYNRRGAAGDRYDQIEGLKGSKYDDTLVGDAASNGLIGGNGDDWLYGGAGDDTLMGGAGGDTLVGGSGNDLASYADARGGVMAGLDNQFANSGEAAGDRYYGVEDLGGSKFDDILIGDRAGNRLYGLDGEDFLLGGAGDDVLIGGAGADSLWGGGGGDIFAFADIDALAGDTDTILDFNSGTDIIDLSGIDADANTDGDQSFSFIKDADFSGSAGELSCRGGLLAGDVDGDGAADFQVAMLRSPPLVESDFYL